MSRRRVVAPLARSALLAAVSVALLAAPSAAQPATAPPAAAPRAAGGTPSHRAAVQRLLDVTRVRETMEQSTESMLQMQLRQAPQLEPYAQILRDFHKEQMNWAALEPELAQLYMEAFSERELRELVAFYESPIGRKMLARMPTLMTKSTELTMTRLQASMPRLMERLQAAMQADAPPPPR